MAPPIKISADTSSLNKSIMDIARSTKSLGKNKVSLISKEEQKFIQEGAKRGIEGIKKVIEQQNQLLAKTREERDKLVKGTEEERKKQLEIVKLLREKAKLESQSIQLQKASSSVAPTAGDKTKGILSKIPGVNKVVGSGMSPAMMLGGAAMAVGAFGVSRGMAGLDTYSEGVDNRVKLRGMGVRKSLQNTQGAADLGMSSLDYRAAQVGSINTFGKANSQESDILGRQGFERNYGLESGSITNAGASLQASIGSQGASDSMMKLQASINASSIEEAIGPYLEQAVAFLGSINESGTLDKAEIAGLLADFTSRGESSQRVSKAFTGIQNGIKGSSGEANAFLQSSFARQGIGKGSIGATQAAIEQGGLFGINPNDVVGLKGRDGAKSAMEKMGISGAGTGTEARASGIYKQMMEMMGAKKGENYNDLMKRDPQSALMGGNFLKRSGLAKTGIEGMGVMGLMEDVSQKKIGGAEFQKKMDRMQMSPELKNLEDIKTSNEGQYQAIEAMHTTIKDQLGNNLVPIANAMKTVLMNIDKGLSEVFGAFGYGKNPEFTGESSFKEGTKLDKNDRRSLVEAKAQTENELASINKELQAPYDPKRDMNELYIKKNTAQKKLANFDRSLSNTGTQTTEFDEFRRHQVAGAAKEVTKLLATGGKITADPMMSIMKEQNAILSEIRDTTKRPGNTKPKIKVISNPSNKVAE